MLHGLSALPLQHAVQEIKRDPPVEVVEERDEVETELDERFLLVARQCAEDFRCVIHVILGHDPVESGQLCGLSPNHLGREPRAGRRGGPTC